MDWLTGYKIPIGKTAKQVFDWLQDNASGFFDLVSIVMESFIDWLLWILQSPSPLIMVAIFTGIAYGLQRSWKIALLTLLGLLLIINQGYWEEATESLALVLSSSFVCMALGVPIGIFAARRPRFYTYLAPILDLMQTLPTFVYLIPAIVFFGIGMVPGLIATVIFVLPAPIRLTHLGITNVPEDQKEAADSFGATKWQKLRNVEIPNALPQIMTGLNQTIMLSLSMVVIAALVGADGLGVPVVRALNSVNTSLGFESGIVIVIVAILLDRILRIHPKKSSSSHG